MCFVSDNLSEIFRTKTIQADPGYILRELAAVSGEGEKLWPTWTKKLRDKQDEKERANQAKSEKAITGFANPIKTAFQLDV